MNHALSGALSDVLQPISQASGLPNANYISPEAFAVERSSILFDGWAGIGFGKDVPAGGDARPIDFAGMPLLVVRNKTGAINVFQNTCRHRGMILVEAPTRITGALRCPYHSWCYDLDGTLRATPHVGGPGHNSHPDFRSEDLGLIRVRSHVWRDVIFVNVSGKAPSFADYAGALITRWSEFDGPLHHGGENASLKLDVHTNWKLAVENYCESYHLPWVHPSLNTYSRLEDHYNIEGPNSFSGQGTTVYRQLRDDDGTCFPDFAGLGPRWDTAAEYIALYPNVLFGVHRDHAFAIVLEPRGVARTLEHVELYYSADVAADPRLDRLQQRNAAQWKTVFEEDIFVVEGMQRGRQGVMFDGGRFSPAMDGPTHAFHRWIAERLLRA